jgi:hypothetical protein
MPVSAAEDQALVKLLCTPMTETARANALGITRPSYYRRLDRLARIGVLRPRGELESGMSLRGAHPRSRHSGTHHAPVQHISWADEIGRWEVQGQLLGRWQDETTNNTTITIRWHTYDFVTIAFEVRPLNRWSTVDTVRHLPPWEPWNSLRLSTTKNLTIAIAHLIDAEAVIVPEMASVD